MPSKTMKEMPAHTDPLLRRIKQDIFRDLKEYIKCFPDLDLWQFSTVFDAKKDDDLMNNALDKALHASEGILLYIHLPFCFEQCSYCNAFPWKVDGEIQEIYIEYLLKEAELFSKAEVFNERQIFSVYFGGGTPTCFSADQITKVLYELGDLFELKKDCNITCELHPLHARGQDGRRTIGILKKAGVNRLSMGVQTFDQQVLSYCARHHTTEDVKDAVSNIQDFQIANNVDMMTGLPGQTVDILRNDLSLLSEIKPGAVEYMRHGVINQRAIRVYGARPHLWSSKDDLFEMNLLCHRWLEENRYEQNGYFSSNSRFFPYRVFWLKEVPYLALGAGTRSHFGDVSFTKASDLRSYFSSIDKNELPIDRFRLSSATERIFRTLLLRLQTSLGVERGELRARYGDGGLEAVAEIIDQLKDYHLVTDEGGVIRLTHSYGRYFVEDICQRITEHAGLAIMSSTFEGMVKSSP